MIDRKNQVLGYKVFNSNEELGMWQVSQWRTNNDVEIVSITPFVTGMTGNVDMQGTLTGEHSKLEGEYQSKVFVVYWYTVGEKA